jgi:putative hydrolase of the HAD superfamily
MHHDSVIVFDGDDTLWSTEELYQRARLRIRRRLQAVGLDGDYWERIERKLDLERVSRSALAWHRFPVSCLLAYRGMEPALRGWRRTLMELRILVLALAVFWEKPRLVNGAEQVLSAVGDPSRVVLLTKGQPWVQRRRIRQSGLRHSFAACIIVPDKNETTFRSVVTQYPAGTWLISVGNSLASDINPSLNAGFGAILVAGDMWEYELRETAAAPGAYRHATSLKDVPKAITELEEAHGTETLHMIGRA